MTDELTSRAERAIADLESAGAFLRGPFFEAVVCKAVKESIAATQSPYVDRAGAAARWRCSESEIDRAAKAGVLTKLNRGGTPLFLKEQGDDAIRNGWWKTKN